MFLLRPREPRNLSRYALSVAAAIVLHALAVVAIVLSPSAATSIPRTAKPSQAVSLRTLTTEQWNKNAGRPPSAKSAPEVRQPKPKPEEPPKGQIVDVAPGNGQTDPNSRFIAESNNKVDKQTRAKEQTAFYRNAMPQRTASEKRVGAGSATVAAPSSNGNNGDGRDERVKQSKDARAALEIPKVKRQTQLDLKEAPAGPGVAVENRTEKREIKGNSDKLSVGDGAEAGGADPSRGKSGAPGIERLLPSAAEINRMSGAAPNDHLADVEEGDGTFLSTREWQYAGFFNRVKQSVGQHWEPNAALQIRDPSGKMYGGRDRITLLTVVLDPDGKLKSSAVEQSSGLDFLDAEAMRAFERAQPFPNPPPGLVAADHTVKFQFGFYMQMSGGPRFRLFRESN